MRSVFGSSRWGLVGVVLVLAIWATLSARSEEALSPYWDIRPSYTRLEVPETNYEMPQARFREGTQLKETRGIFRATGDRYTFFASGDSGRFVVLENLNLDRIARTLDDNPTIGQWLVSGTITEFQGNNYLLIDRAVVTGSAPGDGEPDSQSPAP